MIYDYYRDWVRRLEARRARLGEWEFAAAEADTADLLLAVPAGWRPLVRDLHRSLLDVDPDYRFFDAVEDNARLRFLAEYSRGTEQAAHLVSEATRLSTSVCVVCAAAGERRRRLRPEILCDACFAADRAAAAERGEWYANLALLYFKSCDPAHPSPDDLAAFLDEES